MRRRSLFIMLVLNAIVSAAVILGVLAVMNPSSNQQTANQIVITVPILVTSTVDPNATPIVRIITATPLPGSIGPLPTGLLETPGVPTTPINTFDAQALEANTSLQGTATALPQNCILHTVAEGDTPFGIAEQYGADGAKLMEVNGLNDETASLMQIGDVLIVPLEGCPLTAADVATEEPTEESADTTASTTDGAEATSEATSDVTAAPTVRPTVTLPPTAASAQVEIVEVTGAGDITAEGVVVRNVGNTINLKNWTLTNSKGDTYTFAERFLFSNALVTVYSRSGTDTAIALFWNRSQPAFGTDGDVITLKDDKGVVQSTYRVTAP